MHDHFSDFWRSLDASDAAASLIITASEDADPAARLAACYFLGLIGDKSAIPVLIDRLRDISETAAVRGMAAEALSDLRAAASIPDLIDCLDAPETEVRFWSIFALGVLKAREALPRLREIEASDTAFLPGWHSLQKEAQDAILQIESNQ